MTKDDADQTFGKTKPALGRDFYCFYAGQSASILGSSMAPVALTFGVLIASGGSTSQLSIVLAARMIPMLILLLIGGVTADRFSRRTTLVVTNLGAALTQAVVVVLLVTDNYHVVPIAIIEFVNGGITAFTTPALRGLVPEIVRTDGLQRANSLLSTSKNFSKILGPAVAGILVSALNPTWAIAIDSITYLIAALALCTLTVSSRPKSAKRSFVMDLKEGWSIFSGTTWVWSVTVAFAIVNMFQAGAWQILGPTIIGESNGAQGWGYILAFRGIGLLLAGVIMLRIPTPRRLLFISLLCGAGGAFSLIAIGIGAPYLIVLGVSLISGVGSGVLGIGWDTSLQTNIPKSLVSRVSSYDNLLSFAAIPIGQIVIGTINDGALARIAMLACGVVYFVAALLPLLSRSVRGLSSNGLPAAGVS